MRTELIRFELPEPYTHGDEPEKGAPELIEHRSEYMFDDQKCLLQHYNYFVYRWQLDGIGIIGRTYVDEISRIAIFLPFEQFSDKRYENVHTWLQRRFTQIDTFEPRSGVAYVPRWLHRSAKLQK